MKRDSTRAVAAPRMKDQFREATTRSILDAAERTFAQEGVQTARMEAIAAAAGVSVGTVYNYFEDRAALLDALLRARREALFEALDRELAAPPQGAWRAQLEAFLKVFLAHVEAHRGFFTILYQGDLKVVRSHGSTHAYLAEIERRFDEIVRRGLNDGALRDEPHGLYAPVLAGMCRATALRGLQRPHEDLASYAAPLAALFLRGAEAAP